MWGAVGQGKMGADRGEDGELYYQERVAVIWIEKVKSMSRTGIFHVLFALFFLTLTNTILQILSRHPHHTRSKPFRLLTQFTDNQKTRVLNP